MTYDWKAEIDSQSRFITTEDGRRITRWRCDCCGAEDAELDWDSSEVLQRPAAYCPGGCEGGDSDKAVVVVYHDEPCFTAEKWQALERYTRRANHHTTIALIRSFARGRPVSLADAAWLARRARALDREARRREPQWDGMPEEGGDDECPF